MDWPEASPCGCHCLTAKVRIYTAKQLITFCPAIRAGQNFMSLNPSLNPVNPVSKQSRNKELSCFFFVLSDVSILSGQLPVESE
jgi:hypothetical protein